MSNESQVADHPEQLGRLAAGVRAPPDRAGGRRSGSTRAAATRQRRRRRRSGRGVLRACGERRSRRCSRTRRRPSANSAGAAAAWPASTSPASSSPSSRVSVGGALAPVQEALSRLRDAGAVAEPNHVVLGSQSVRGSPVGAEAHFVGGMMFTANVIDTDVGPVLKTTSDPAPAPAWLRQPLGLGEPHRAPQILVLDTGLRTLEAKGDAVEHPQLTCARLHAPWMRNSTVGAVDDEDEYDDDQSRTLDFEAGHGTFITGIIQQICPDAEVHVAGVLSSFGDGDVDTVVASFERALDHGRTVRHRRDEPGRLHERRRRRVVRGRPRPAASATASAWRRPATSPRPGRTSRPRRRRSWGSGRSARPTRRGSPTSADGSTPARRASTSSARSSSVTRAASTSHRSPAGHGGAARASPPPRSLPPSPRRCT